MARVEYDPPIQAGVGCRNCGNDIQAVARIVGRLEIAGLYEYVWTHVDTGSSDCPPTVRYAAPYDGWTATRLTETALEARRAARYATQRALDAALGEPDLSVGGGW